MDCKVWDEDGLEMPYVYMSRYLIGRIPFIIERFLHSRVQQQMVDNKVYCREHAYMLVGDRMCQSGVRQLIVQRLWRSQCIWLDKYEIIGLEWWMLG